MPVIEKLVDSYKLWQDFLPHFPKTARYTLAERIDSLFLEIIEASFSAVYLGKEDKIPLLRRATAKLDLLKFLLRISWEIKVLDNKKYIAVSERLDEIGRMLGGWNRQLSR